MNSTELIRISGNSKMAINTIQGMAVWTGTHAWLVLCFNFIRVNAKIRKQLNVHKTKSC
jgi:hypothetical protein